MTETKAVGEKKTLVEEGTEFKGSLASTCPIEVKGVIEGQVTGPALTVSRTGAVRGKVKVAEIRSEGELAGEFDATEVRLSGTVKDNTVIRAKSLEVKLASSSGMQVMFGDCELEVGDEPAVEAKASPPVDVESVRASARPSEPPARKKSNGSIAPAPLEEPQA